MSAIYVPMLAEQRRIQSLPRDRTRFQSYLTTILNGRRDDVRFPPLVLANPMAREHVTTLLDDCLKLDLDRQAADWASEASAEWPEGQASDRMSLVVIDDALGGWTNRYAVEYQLRIASSPNDPRFWITVPLWSSEPLSQANVRERIRAAIARTAWRRRRGRPSTLTDVLAQEGAALGFAGSNLSIDSDDLEYTSDVLASLADASDMSTIVVALFGDVAARSLGMAPLGLSENAGLAYALAVVNAMRPLSVR